jgi:hypothetical protein
MAVQRGCLVLADVGGYTKYLTGVELEHSHDILADLLSVVVGELSAGLTLAKLEGDAVFCYVTVPEGEELDGAALMATIESCYFAFQRRLADIERATSCTCDACRHIPSLSLKFLAHLGTFVIHEVVGMRELVGPDVILAHRMLKNTVTETTGLKGYAFFTGACVSAYHLDTDAIRMRRHVETYEDVGQIEGFVHDLERRWQEEREATVVYLGPGDAPFEFSEELPGPPPVVWDWINSPRKRALWQYGVVRVDQENPGGVPGVGTTNHCVHGADAVVEQILDWRPFRYVTDRSLGDFGSLLMTVEFEPVGDGDRTRVTYRAEPEADDPDQKAALAEAFLPMLQQMMELNFVAIRPHLESAAAAPA